ncbi:MAG: ketopantoate reductase C-terminal domain-containing protein [Pseudomonadota bacterium]
MLVARTCHLKQCKNENKESIKTKIAVAGAGGRIGGVIAQTLNCQKLPSFSNLNSLTTRQMRDISLKANINGAEVLIVSFPKHAINSDSANRFLEFVDSNAYIPVIVNGLTAFCSEVFLRLPDGSTRLQLKSLEAQHNFINILKEKGHTPAGAIADFSVYEQADGSIKKFLSEDHAALLLQNIGSLNPKQNALLAALNSRQFKTELCKNYDLKILYKLCINSSNLLAVISGKTVGGLVKDIKYRNMFLQLVEEIYSLSLKLSQCSPESFPLEIVKKYIDKEAALTRIKKVDPTHPTSTGADIIAVAKGEKTTIENLFEPVIELGLRLGVSMPGLVLAQKYVDLVKNEALTSATYNVLNQRLEIFFTARRQITNKFEQDWKISFDNKPKPANLINLQRALAAVVATGIAGTVLAMAEMSVIAAPILLFNFTIRAVAQEKFVRRTLELQSKQLKLDTDTLHEFDLSDTLLELSKLRNPADKSAQYVRYFRATRELSSSITLFLPTLKPSRERDIIFGALLAFVFTAVIMEETYAGAKNVNWRKESLKQLKNFNVMEKYQLSFNMILKNIKTIDKSTLSARLLLTSSIAAGALTAISSLNKIQPLDAIALGLTGAFFFTALPLMKIGAAKKDFVYKVLGAAVKNKNVLQDVERRSESKISYGFNQLLEDCLILIQQKIDRPLSHLERAKLINTVSRLLLGPFSSLYLLKADDPSIGIILSVSALFLIAAMDPFLDLLLNQQQAEL